MFFYIFCLLIDEFLGPAIEEPEAEEVIRTLEQELLEESRDRNLTHADIIRIINAVAN